MATNTHQIKTNITASGSVSVGTTLSVTGASTLAAVAATALTVSGTSTLTGGIVGGLSVTGNSTFNNNLVVDGDLTVNGSFSFLGGSVFSDATFAVQDNVDATKQLMVSVGGAATSTTSTFTFAQTANRVITFPDADMTVTGTALSQTITNKTIDADSNTISNIDDGNIKVGADIARTKLLAGTANHVLVNDGSGVMSSEAQLTPLKGGTGQDFSASTGVLKVAAGTVSATTIVNADVDATAAIDRSKIADGTANHVIINSAGGALSSEASLAETRGGTAQTTYAAGDILYASASNTLAKLPLGSAGQHLKVSDSSLPTWESVENPSREVRLYDEFMGGLTGGGMVWNSWAGGAGAQASNVITAVSAQHPGVLSFTTGTTATGRMGLGLSISASPNSNGLVIAADTFIDEYLIELTALSTGAEEYIFQCGLHRTAVATQQTDGVVLKYDRATYGTNWQCETNAASVTTRTDSGVAVATGWVKLRMESNTTNCKFYVNDVLVATHTTNIPTLQVGPGFKTDKTVGTAASVYRIDYYSGYRRFSTAR